MNVPKLPSASIWLVGLALPVAAWSLSGRTTPAWIVMWVLAFSIFLSCKWLSWMAARTDAPCGRHVAYWLAWPGMDADAFLAPARPSVVRPGWTQAAAASAKMICGIALVTVAAHWLQDAHDLVLGWAGMIGLVLALHFGAFELLSWGWRRAGIDAKPLMNRPLLSASLGEFWGRRWNTAFRDLTHRFLFRPLAARFGTRVALSIGFVASGLIHDLVISLPAQGGYGCPTLFFGLQGVGILLERSPVGRGIGLGRGVRGRTFTLVMLLLPVPFLFHSPFVRRIILPMLESLTEICHA